MTDSAPAADEPEEPTITIHLNGPGGFFHALEVPLSVQNSGIVRFNDEYYRYDGELNNFSHAEVYVAPRVPYAELYPALFRAVFQMKLANGYLNRENPEARLRAQIERDFNSLAIESSFLIGSEIFAETLEENELEQFVDGEHCATLELCARHEFGWVANWILNCHFDGEYSDPTEFKTYSEKTLAECRARAAETADD